MNIISLAIIFMALLSQPALSFVQPTIKESLDNAWNAIQNESSDEEVISLLKIVIDQEENAWALGQLGRMYAMQREFGQADEYLGRCLAVEGVSGITSASARHDLGNNFLSQNMYEDAIVSLTEAKKEYDELQMTDNSDMVLNSLGAVFLYLGDYDKAKESFLSIIAQSNRSRTLLDAKGNLSKVYHLKGDLSLAVDTLVDALGHLESAGLAESDAKWIRLDFLYRQSQIRQDQGKYTLAKKLLIEADQGYSDILKISPNSKPVLRQLAAVRLTLGNTVLNSLALGDIELARGYYESAKTNYHLADDPFMEQVTQGTIAVLERRVGNGGESLKLTLLALDYFRGVGSELNIANQLNNLSILEISDQDYSNGEKHAKEALAINKRIGRDAEVAKNLMCLAVIEEKNGRSSEAERFLLESKSFLEKTDFDQLYYQINENIRSIRWD